MDQRAHTAGWSAVCIFVRRLAQLHLAKRDARERCSRRTSTAVRALESGIEGGMERMVKVVRRDARLG